MKPKIAISVLAISLIASLGINLAQYVVVKKTEKNLAETREKLSKEQATAEYEKGLIEKSWRRVIADTNDKNNAELDDLRSEVDREKNLIKKYDDYFEQTKPIVDEYFAARDAKKATDARRERIRQQNAEEYARRQEANRRYQQQVSDGAAQAVADQSSAQRRAERAAEAYFNDYHPGGNSSILVTSVSVRITSVEPVSGWPGRWLAKGRASLGYYVSSGGSFSNESHEFELTLDANGSSSVDLRS